MASDFTFEDLARMRELMEGVLPLPDLGPWTAEWDRITARGRQVPLRRIHGYTNAVAARLVLAVDLGLPTVRHFKGARRRRQELTAVATTLLMCDLVDPAKDSGELG